VDHSQISSMEAIRHKRLCEAWGVNETGARLVSCEAIGERKPRRCTVSVRAILQASDRRHTEDSESVLRGLEASAGSHNS
jgi:hypothetical protein